MTRKLALVEKSPEPRIDVTLAMRADILARDWGAVHVAGDRAAAIRLPRNWRAPR